jgi:hypothetical protein
MRHASTHRSCFTNKRFRLLLLIGILSFWGRLVPAQAIFDYANGWYSPGQSYLKLLTWQDGIYRISGADIRNAGLNFSPSDIPNLQLFFRGQEQHIHVELSGGDLAYLEFFGLRNDGKIDSSMYPSKDSAYTLIPQHFSSRSALHPV